MLNRSIAAIAHRAPGASRAVLDDARQIELRRQRFLGDRRQRGTQQTTLIGEAGDAPGDIRMIAQIFGDFRLPLRFENTIHIGVEIIFRDRPVVHFSRSVLARRS